MKNLSLYEGSCFKVKASSFKESLFVLKEKWMKVIQDCQSAIDENRDNSLYRKDYLNAHHNLVKAISSVESSNELLELSRQIEAFKTGAEEDAHAYARIEILSILSHHHG